jgi:hypothetical protein
VHHNTVQPRILLLLLVSGKYLFYIFLLILLCITPLIAEFIFSHACYFYVAMAESFQHSTSIFSSIARVKPANMDFSFYSFCYKIALAYLPMTISVMLPLWFHCYHIYTHNLSLSPQKRGKISINFEVY